MVTADATLLTIGETATLYGTDPLTVAGLIRAHQVPVQRIPHSPMGKGLDGAARRVIAQALGVDHLTGRRLAQLSA